MSIRLRTLSQVLPFACLVAAAGCGGAASAPDATAGRADAGIDAGAPDATPLVTIGNGTPVCQGSAVVGHQADVSPNLPDEIGDPALARITPPSYPFTVTSVSYRLTGMQTTCGTNIAHAVSVFAGPTGTTPPTTPGNAQRIPVAASATDLATLVVTTPLPTPITLAQGQDLYVAVEMDANAAKNVAVCLDGCIIPADDNRNFWSEQTAAPFTWDSLYGFGIQVDLAIWAEGKPQ